MLIIADFPAQHNMQRLPGDGLRRSGEDAAVTLIVCTSPMDSVCTLQLCKDGVNMENSAVTTKTNQTHDWSVDIFCGGKMSRDAWEYSKIAALQNETLIIHPQQCSTSGFLVES